MVTAASVLPQPVVILVAVVSAVGTVAGLVLTIINIDVAWHRLRNGASTVKAKLRRAPRQEAP